MVGQDIREISQLALLQTVKSAIDFSHLITS